MHTDPGLRGLMDDLGLFLGLQSFQADSLGIYALRLNGNLHLGLRAAPCGDALLLFADLGAHAPGTALYARLLRANMLWRATSGATLSLTGDDPPHIVIALSVTWRGLNAAMLATTLESFADAALHWSRLVHNESQLNAAQPALSLHASAHR